MQWSIFYFVFPVEPSIIENKNAGDPEECLWTKVNLKSDKKDTIKFKMLRKDAESIKKSFVHHMEYSLGKDEYSGTLYDSYTSIALATRTFDRALDRHAADVLQ